jgi:hypothetical protein
VGACVLDKRGIWDVVGDARSACGVCVRGVHACVCAVGVVAGGAMRGAEAAGYNTTGGSQQWAALSTNPQQPCAPPRSSPGKGGRQRPRLPPLLPPPWGTRLLRVATGSGFLCMTSDHPGPTGTVARRVRRHAPPAPTPAPSPPNTMPHAPATERFSSSERSRELRAPAAAEPTPSSSSTEARRVIPPSVGDTWAFHRDRVSAWRG